MLSLLKIKNIALIDEIGLEFANGLNLLTGETGSGKSIIVDSLGALTGERVSSDLIKEGEKNAQIEGLFNIFLNKDLRRIFDESGIELDDAEEIDIIVRRELSATGKNRIFVNN
ncbi:MAG: AAA family ATPase, partial [Pyrinomonadaceae bacterium]